MWSAARSAKISMILCMPERVSGGDAKFQGFCDGWNKWEGQLALRMDHGSQYLSDHFTNQIKFWGIQPSYAFVEQPQTNGVAERFNRTLKEQIIHGRIYRNIAELWNAVRGFVEQYNAQWIVEKNGYLSPAQARQAWHTAMSLRPAA